MNALLDYEDIVNRLTVEDMLALTTRVTPGPAGQPERGFGVEVLAKVTGLPVSATLTSFEAEAAGSSLERKWSGNKAGCAMHGRSRNYIFWVCTCGFVFWHNLIVHATMARTNEVHADNELAVLGLRKTIAEVKAELGIMREEAR